MVCHKSHTWKVSLPCGYTDVFGGQTSENLIIQNSQHMLVLLQCVEVTVVAFILIVFLTRMIYVLLKYLRAKQKRQDRQSTYKHNIKCIYVLWKSNNYYRFWVCVFSLSYPVSNAHVLYHIVKCGLSDCTIFFPHLSHEWHNFQ